MTDENTHIDDEIKQLISDVINGVPNRANITPQQLIKDTLPELLNDLYKKYETVKHEYGFLLIFFIIENAIINQSSLLNSDEIINESDKQIIYYILKLLQQIKIKFELNLSQIDLNNPDFITSIETIRENISSTNSDLDFKINFDTIKNYPKLKQYIDLIDNPESFYNPSQLESRGFFGKIKGFFGKKGGGYQTRRHKKRKLRINKTRKNMRKFRRTIKKLRK